jgi:hypothetical protein
VRCEKVQKCDYFVTLVRCEANFDSFQLFCIEFAFRTFSHYFSRFSQVFGSITVEQRPSRWKKCENAKMMQKVRCKCKMQMRCESGAMRCNGFWQKVQMWCRTPKKFLHYHPCFLLFLAISSHNRV